MTFEVTKGASYAVLYSLLSFFTLLAFFSLPRISSKFPAFIRNRLLLPGLPDASDEKSRTDYFLSARRATGAWAVAFSFFGESMGTWIFYGTSELGADPTISWLGIIGYSFACALPGLCLMAAGPAMRRATEPHQVYSISDFAKLRYGRIIQVIVAGVALFGMFIFLVAEMTGIARIFVKLTGQEGSGVQSDKYKLSVVLSIGAFTIFYTSFAGLPASIISDRVQSVAILILILMLLIATSVKPENHVTVSQFQVASNWTIDGLQAAVTFNIAVLAAAVFDQGNWQRVYAADSDRSIRLGNLWGSIFIFLVMMYFGIMGMIAYAENPEAFDSFYYYSYLSFFEILKPLSNFWHIIVLIITTSLSASTIDTLQNAIASVFSYDLLRCRCNPLIFTRLLIVAINAPAIYIATNANFDYDILSLFLIGNMVSTTCAAPIMMGLQKKDALYGYLPAPTEFGCLAGCVSGVVTVIVNGYINHLNMSNPFEYFWLRNGAICSFCGEKTMWTFFITPPVTVFITYLFSFLDIKIRGKRAREPLIRFSSTQKADDKIADEEFAIKNADQTVSVEPTETDVIQADVEVVDDGVAVDTAKANGVLTLPQPAAGSF